MAAKFTIADVSYIEGLIPKEYGQDAKEVPGSRSLLESLEDAEAPWAIVTSGTWPLISGWVSALLFAMFEPCEGSPNRISS